MFFTRFSVTSSLVLLGLSLVVVVLYLQMDTEGEVYRRYKDQERVELSVAEMMELSKVADKLVHLKEMTLRLRAGDPKTAGALGRFVQLKRLRIMGDKSTPDPLLIVGLYQLKALHYLEIRSVKLDNLPANLVHLRDLNTLTVVHCELKIPPYFLERMLSLHHIDLSHNKLRHLSVSLWDLGRLKSFRADHNNLKKLPVILLLSESLQHLSLSNNALQELDTLPSDATQRLSSSIKVLRLDHNQLETVVDYLGDLPQLEILDLSNNRLNRIEPSILESNLTKLDLSGNRLTALPDPLKHPTSLQQLNLANNQLTRLPDWIKGLEYLSIEGNLQLEHTARVQDSTRAGWPRPWYVSQEELPQLRLESSSRIQEEHPSLEKLY